jgi:2-oxoglutarate ferredoxin oxidoreductase subunit alpha
MTATSGGGFGLMVETLGLVGMAEVPLVVIEGQRPGPATGLPTKTEQGDLKFVLSAGTGDFPKIIIAPKSNEDCYTETKRAFYLAEKYQLPVIVLIDKHLAESYKSINLDKEEKNYIFDAKERINLLTEKDAIHLKSHLNKDGLFKRYAVNPDLLHRTIPGTPNGIYTCAGDEHDEVGEITEDYQMRDKMMQRRMGKLPQILSELPAPEIIGEKNANYTLITWGSSHDAVLEAMQELNSNGDKKTKINLLCLTYMHPFQTSAVKNILSKSKNTILIENNYCGQLGELIAEKTGILVDHKILKSNGTTFTVEELITKIRAIIK